MKSKFLKTNTKMKIYKMIIRPAVTYSSQTWTLTAKDENSLCILTGKYYGKYLVLSVLIIYGEYETTWRLIN